MEELLTAIVRGLVEDKDNIRIVKDEPNEEGLIVYHINVSPDDMGRVIGKQGRIAKAIRTIARTAANRLNERVAVEID